LLWAGMKKARWKVQVVSGSIRKKYFNHANKETWTLNVSALILYLTEKWKWSNRGSECIVRCSHRVVVDDDM
jgi:hypothetical protein